MRVSWKISPGLSYFGVTWKNSAGRPRLSEGLRPLRSEKRQGRGRESARALLKAAADRDVSTQDMARSAATIARSKGHVEILQMLRGQLDAARTRREENPGHVLIDLSPAD